jgi:Outer membrane protein beta-barrel domain
MRLRTTALLAVLLLSASLAGAQVRSGTWEITPFYGYLWGGSFPSGSNALFLNQVDVADHGVYGIGVGYNLTSVWEFETRWARAETHFEPTHSDQVFGGTATNLGNLTIDYIMGYSTFNFGHGRFVPYITMGLGAALLNPGPRLDLPDFACPGANCANPPTSTRFTGSIGTGLKIFVNKNFGFLMDGRFYDTYLSSGSCTTFGNGTHCHNNGSNWLLNWETTGGLVIAF